MYSRYPIVEIMKNASAQSVIKKFNKIISMFGFPIKVLTDNRPPFQSALLKLYFQFLKIKYRKITSCSPQTNGLNEKFLKVFSLLKQKLKRRSLVLSLLHSFI